MTQSVPDSVSAFELQNILDAKADDALADSLGLTEEPDVYQCLAALNAMPSRFQNPLIHQRLALVLVSRLHGWHVKIAAQLLEEGNPDALVWAQDERTLSYVFELLKSVNLDD